MRLPLRMRLNSFERHVQPELATIGGPVARGEAAVNPTRGIEKPAVRCKPKRIASPNEAARLLKALPADDRPPCVTPPSTPVSDVASSSRFAGKTSASLPASSRYAAGGMRWRARSRPSRGKALAPFQFPGSCATSLWSTVCAKATTKALSAFMGHANIGITLDLYGHLMP